MTVFDFMLKMGKYENFNISIGSEDITKDKPVAASEVYSGEEDRESVLDSLELKAVSYDFDANRIIAEAN